MRQSSQKRQHGSRATGSSEVKGTFREANRFLGLRRTAQQALGRAWLGIARPSHGSCLFPDTGQVLISIYRSKNRKTTPTLEKYKKLEKTPHDMRQLAVDISLSFLSRKD